MNENRNVDVSEGTIKPLPSTLARWICSYCKTENYSKPIAKTACEGCGLWLGVLYKTTGDLRREAFETWCITRWGGDRGGLIRKENGEYLNGHVEFAWKAWQSSTYR